MKSILLFVSLFLSLLVQAQDTIVIDSVAFNQQKELKKDFSRFTSDQLGYIYLVNSDQIEKLNSSGEEMFIQSYKNMGDISMIDASQSLRTLLFYRDLTQILFVDNTLSVQGESIKLEKEGFPFVTLACASFMNNHFWIYSTDEFMIKRLDRQLGEMATSVNIAQLIGKELNPDFICESGEYVFLNDSELGILQFDLFGTYIRTIPVKNAFEFVVEDDKLMYLENDFLMVLSLRDFSLGKLELPLKGVKQFRKWKNKLYLTYEGGITIYSLDKR